MNAALDHFNVNTGGPLSEDNYNRFTGALTASKAYGGGINGPAMYRMDATERQVDDMVAKMGAPQKARMDSAIAKFKTDIKKRNDSKNVRTDAFNVNSGLFMARQLEFIYAEVLNEPVPPLNGFVLFGIDNSVPPGMQTHLVRRLYQNGEAAVYRGGTDNIPRVGLSQREEPFNIRHYVTSFALDLFEKLAGQAAQTNGFPVNLVAELLRTARDVIMSFANQKIWYGDVESGIYGVLTYPWIAKKTLATAWNTGTDPDDILADLNALVNFPIENSKQAMSPNRAATSPKARNFLFNTARSSTSDKTIGQFFIENNAHIDKIEEAWELQGTGIGGTDIFLAYRDDRRGIQNVMVQAFATLPVQLSAFSEVTYAYMTHGGIVMRDVGNNILGFITF